MLGTYWRHTRIDEGVRARVGAAVRQQGREWLLQSPADYQRAVDELTKAGFDAAYELPDPNRLTREQRATALDEILARGITPILFRGAALLENSGRTLDRFGGFAAPRLQAAARQDDGISCEKAWDMQILSVQATALFVCLMPPLWEICLLLQGDVLLMQAMKLVLC
jgi:hypothetical protein